MKQLSDSTNALLEKRKESGTSYKIVFTNGCFDLLHVGHLQYLREARELGDALVVGLNSDESVATLKGPDRPILGEEDRAAMLRALRFVDSVEIFSEPDPLRLILEVTPDILVKGGDYKVSEIVGAKETLERGGQVVPLQFVEGKSSTQIIEKIVNNIKNSGTLRQFPG